jgi:hypothetical protein
MCSQRGTGTDVTIQSYNFNFGDGTSQPVTPTNNGQSASVSHTYTQNDTPYRAYVTIQAKEMSTNITENCVVAFTTPKQNECKPGVPVGSDMCSPTVQYCKDNIPMGDVRCVSTPVTPQCETNSTGNQCVLAATTELSKTGPGDVIALVTGIFGATTLSYRYYLSRKFGQ